MFRVGVGVPAVRFPSRIVPRVLSALPLRWRLTLWYTLMLAITLWVFTALVYAVLAQFLAMEIDNSLEDRAEEVNRSLRLETVIERRPQVRLILPHPNVFAADDTFVQVLTLDGEIRATSANLGEQGLPVDPAIVSAAASAGQSYFESIEIEGHRFRLLNTPLRVGTRVVGVLQVGRSLAASEALMSWLQVATLVGGIISVVCSAIIGSTLARAALRPLGRLAAAAEQIGETQDLGRRVDVPASHDEVGRLAATFNGMLDRLQAAYAALEATLAAQRRFVADASHELRTPLTTIRGNAGLLRQFPEMAPDDRAEALGQIVSESERMSRLVHDLLTLARADGGLRLELHPVELRPIVDAVVRQSRMMSSDVVVIVNTVEDLTVLGDGDAIQQLLLILVENGLKYTPSGGTVTISARRHGDEAVLTVADNGIGIAPEDLPHIFERFYRADRARSAGGTGLGLAIARWIIDEHQGSIDVASEPGRGSTFTVHLPLAPVRSYPTLTSA